MFWKYGLASNLCKSISHISHTLADTFAREEPEAEKREWMLSNPKYGGGLPKLKFVRKNYMSLGS
jgi:hypothetical protein